MKVNFKSMLATVILLAVVFVAFLGGGASVLQINQKIQKQKKMLKKLKKKKSQIRQ